MTHSTGPTPASGIGANIPPLEWFAYNRTGSTLTLGAVCNFDEAGASAQTETERSSGGIYGNIITPATANFGTATAHPGFGACVVVGLGEQGGIDNSIVKVHVKGPVQVQITATQDIAFGDRLGLVNGVYTMSETAASGVRVYAKADEEIASAVAGTLYWVQFDGLGAGFGQELA